LAQFFTNLWKKLTKSSAPAAVQHPSSSAPAGSGQAASHVPPRPSLPSTQPIAAAQFTPKPALAPVLDIQSTPSGGVAPPPKIKPERVGFVVAPGERIVSRNGFSRILSDVIGEGGTSSIHSIKGSDDIVCKIFTTDFLKLHGEETRDKIQYQIDIKGHIDNKFLVAWPRTSIYSPDGTWLGYSMSKINGVPLNRIVHPILMKKYSPDLDRINLVEILIQIAKGVTYLNNINVFVGDFNPENFLVNICDNTVTFIDSDGYQISNFKCLFVKPEYIPPEHLDLVAEEVVRDKMSDSFSLSVLLFQSFMMLRHPYDSIGGGDLLENTRGGHFPYGLGGVAPGKNGAIPPGPWYNMWSHLPYAVKNGFIKTLSAGTDHPDDRTLASSWAKLLSGYLSDLKKGYHRHELLPLEAKKSIYRGKTGKGTESV
jgi:DNA-binding helix-hairpin-helix protein with protein kinase domain